MAKKKKKNIYIYIYVCVCVCVSCVCVCVFQVSALKKLGMVGRHKILFCRNILYRYSIFQYIFPHFSANLSLSRCSIKASLLIFIVNQAVGSQRNSSHNKQSDSEWNVFCACCETCILFFQMSILKHILYVLTVDPNICVCGHSRLFHCS